MTNLFITVLVSQGLFAKSYGGTNDDVAYPVIQTADGGYAVTGYTNSFGAGGYDILAIKLASEGSIAWARTFGGPSNDYVEYPRSIIQTADGNYAIVGRTQSFGAGNYDVLLLKLDREGNYPGCVQDCSPMALSPALTISSPSSITSCDPIVVTPTLAVNSPDLTITDPCEALLEHEEISINQQPPITCSLVPSAALFLSALDVPLRIYSADGRLAYSGQLKRGETTISLEKGVYIWIADTHKGKVVVR
ncbi:MAG: hypothetical protein ABIM46_05350 [candidate division WOR-3 bacterium]